MVSEVTLQNMKQNVDPILWDFITTLTQTARARRGIRNETVEISPRTQAKSIRQLYCLAVVMFCINPRCNFPFHVPLTDAIVTHGGTLELVHLFNRVGAVASVEAHERLMKSVVKAREKQGYFADLTPGAFRVVSIDNIDIMQRHAQVYVSSSERSWHGTSVQCVEPKPMATKVVANSQVQDDTSINVHMESLLPASTPIDEITMLLKRQNVSPAGTPSCWQKSKCLRLESTPSRPMMSSTSGLTTLPVSIAEVTDEAVVSVVRPTACATHTDTYEACSLRHSGESSHFDGSSMSPHPCEASFEGEPCDLFHPGESCALLHPEVPCNSPIYSSSHPTKSHDLPKSQETVIQFGDLTEKDYCSSDCEKAAFKEMLTVWFHYNLIKHTIQMKDIEHLTFNSSF